jgi:hypothetical protein
MPLNFEIAQWKTFFLGRNDEVAVYSLLDGNPT